MAESSSMMALVAVFIGIAIMLGVGIQILGNTQVSTNCASLPGGSHTTYSYGSGKANITATVANSQANSTGWALSCYNNQTSIQNAYTLLIVIMIVIAAVAILFVVRML